MDDALSYEKIKIDNNDYFRVGIHISDVSYWLQRFKLMSFLDERKFTLYSKFSVYPIFPKILSNHLFSLKKDIASSLLPPKKLRTAIL